MTSIITNTSPIIALSMINKFSLLCNLFDDVYVLKAVFNELTSSFNEDDFGKKETLEAVHSEKVILYSVKADDWVQQMYAKLHYGELETIIGGKELDIDFVLIDERGARSMAKSLFLTPLGTLGLLRLAKSQGKIDKVKPYIDTLVKNGFRIGKQLYEQVLKQENKWS
ncbi:DUF3368 domain-containing protein [Oceanobacillus jeddahense]|uniref:DUF3368 domain-containing protein n=1 Tax=Oceanobacillus jeddahense TaxID=1462527 RepID=UPI000595E0EE|nr:DUF3368 domain-containing protein [Oceanobacillus jeddahense]